MSAFSLLGDGCYVWEARWEEKRSITGLFYTHHFRIAQGWDTEEHAFFVIAASVFKIFIC